ncbi:hypothetical protein MASR2M70_02840 [Bacillota bacterium]
MKDLSRQVHTFLDTLLLVDRRGAEELLFRQYEESGDIKDVEHIIISSMKIIGDGWEEGEYSLAQIYMAGIICEELFDKMFPETDVKRISSPKMAICVFLDQHSLGKRIVKSVIRSRGYEITDLGQGLDVAALVQACRESNFDILLISTLMLPSALKVSMIKQEFKAKGIPTKIIAGGAPFRFDTTLWQKVGADADGKDATDVVTVIESLMKGE